jgi:hypothetical protein
MELGQYQMQIFASLVVILGAALVAFICDLLKGNNEQLRELALELKVRREEEHKRFQMLAPRALAPGVPAEATAGAPTAALPPAAAFPDAGRVHSEKVAQPEKAAEPVERKPKRINDPNKRAIAPEALAVMQRGVDLATAPPKPRRTPEPEPHTEPAPARAASQDRPIETGNIALVHPAPVQPEFVQPEVEVLAPAASVQPASASAGQSRDWSRLLSVRRTAPPPAQRKSTRTQLRAPQEPAGLLDAVMAAAASAGSASAEGALPAGFQDGFVLSRLVESRQPVSGLVVSIGASALQNGAFHGGSFQGKEALIPAKVRALIQSLLGPSDFAAQSGPDEFLLIYPGERGAQAQRKLSQIAEQLWDFQLRSMGTLSIQFSWGGVEVRSETIDEAIASATERMQETRRGRKIITMEHRTETEAPLRRAV